MKTWTECLEFDTKPQKAARVLCCPSQYHLTKPKKPFSYPSYQIAVKETQNIPIFVSFQRVSGPLTLTTTLATANEYNPAYEKSKLRL